MILLIWTFEQAMRTYFNGDWKSFVTQKCSAVETNYFVETIYDEHEMKREREKKQQQPSVYLKWSSLNDQRENHAKEICSILWKEH